MGEATTTVETETVAPEREGCPECGGRLAIDETETTCAECGLVVDEHEIDHGREWTYYRSDERERTGAPRTPTRHDRGLGSTTIGRGPRAGETKLNRLRMRNRRGRYDGMRDRNLAEGLGQIRRMTGALEYGRSVTEQACALYRQAVEADLLVGRSMDKLAPAAVLATLRVNGLPVSRPDVLEIAPCDAQGLKMGYDVLNRELGLPAAPTPPKEFVPRFASALDVSDAVRTRATELAEIAVESGVANGCKPSGVAAACLYAASRERFSREDRLTQEAVAEAAGVCPPTLRARVADLQAAGEVGG